MLKIDQVENVYFATGFTDLRKSIDGLSAIVMNSFNLTPDEKSLFIFCNRARNRMKVLHFDQSFWIYYFRLEHGKLKWSENKDGTIEGNLEDLKWLLDGYEVRGKRKFKEVTEKLMY